MSADPVVAALVRVRRSRGISQREMAVRLNASQSALSEMETGKAAPFLSTVRRYAEELGYTLVINRVE